MCVRIGKVIQRIEDHRGGKSWRKYVREQGKNVEAFFILASVVTTTGLFGRNTKITHVVWRRR